MSSGVEKLTACDAVEGSVVRPGLVGRFRVVTAIRSPLRRGPPRPADRSAARGSRTPRPVFRPPPDRARGRSRSSCAMGRPGQERRSREGGEDDAARQADRGHDRLLAPMNGHPGAVNPLLVDQEIHQSEYGVIPHRVPSLTAPAHICSTIGAMSRHSSRRSNWSASARAVEGFRPRVAQSRNLASRSVSEGWSPG